MNERHWIPAFAGMTELWIRGCTLKRANRDIYWSSSQTGGRRSATEAEASWPSFMPTASAV